MNCPPLLDVLRDAGHNPNEMTPEHIESLTDYMLVLVEADEKLTGDEWNEFAIFVIEEMREMIQKQERKNPGDANLRTQVERCDQLLAKAIIRRELER